MTSKSPTLMVRKTTMTRWITIGGSVCLCSGALLGQIVQPSPSAAPKRHETVVLPAKTEGQAEPLNSTGGGNSSLGNRMNTAMESPKLGAPLTVPNSSKKSGAHPDAAAALGGAVNEPSATAATIPGLGDAEPTEAESGQTRTEGSTLTSDSKVGSSLFSTEEEAATDGVVSPFSEPLMPSGKRFSVRIDAGALYDSNIYQSAQEEIEDFIYTVGATGRLGWGDVNAQRQSFAFLGYRPQWTIFTENSEQTSLDHDLQGSAQLTGGRGSVGVNGRFQQLSNATVALGSRVERQVWQAGVRAAYGWSDRIRVETMLGLEGATYDGPGFADYTTFTHDTYLDYNLTARSRMGVGYGWGKMDVQSTLGGKQDFQRALARFNWDNGSNLTLNAKGGVEFRDTGVGTQTTPIFAVGAEWRASERTAFRLDATRAVEAAPYASGENYTRTGLTAGVRQKVAGSFGLSLDGGWERYSYSQAAAGAAAASREDDTFFIRPGLTYQVREDFRAEAYFTHRTVDSSGGNGYDVNQAGINFSYDF